MKRLKRTVGLGVAGLGAVVITVASAPAAQTQQPPPDTAQTGATAPPQTAAPSPQFDVAMAPADTATSEWSISASPDSPDDEVVGTAPRSPKTPTKPKPR